MRSVVVVVTNILAHQPLQMSFIQDDHAVEQVPATVANPAFCHAILPWTSKAGSFRLDAEAFHSADHFFIKVRSPVEDQVDRRGVIRECFPQLMRHPGTIWMPSNVPVQNAPSIMGYDEEAVEDAKA